MSKDTAILKVDPEGVGPAAHLVSIFDPATIGDALYEHGWSSSDAIEILTEIARDAANNSARERMAAVKMIEDKSEKALTLAGIIKRVSLEAIQKEGDTTKKLTAEGLQLIKEGAARTLSTLELLEAGNRTPGIIDVDPVEVSNGPGPDGDVPATQHGHASNESRPGLPSPRPGSVSGSGRDGSGTNPECTIHGVERPDPPNTFDPESGSRHGPQQTNQTTTGGAEDERSSRTPVQPGRGHESSQPGEPGVTDQRECRPDGESPQGNGPTESAHTVSRRTTPYTPGEARRRSTAASIAGADSSGGPTAPDVSTPRPSDGTSDRRSSNPRIASRYLPQELAATGFPGDVDQ